MFFPCCNITGSVIASSTLSEEKSFPLLYFYSFHDTDNQFIPSKRTKNWLPDAGNQIDERPDLLLQRKEVLKPKVNRIYFSLATGKVTSV